MQQEPIDDLGFCPSFNCYSTSSTSAARISTQLQQYNYTEEAEDEFEFSFVDVDQQHSSFPLFNSLLQKEVEQEETETEHEHGQGLGHEHEPACSDDSSSDGESPGVFCVWRHKTDGGAGASPLSKCKKSSSTGSGSKRWRIRDLLRRSNSEGKEPMVLLSDKKAAGAGKLKPSSPSVHELLYVQQRAKREGGKRRSYLPYRQGLVGFFTNVNASGKKLPF